MTTTTKPRPTSVAGPKATEVYVDGRYIGLVFPSRDWWVDGWAVVPSGAHDPMEDQPRKSDAIASLVAFMTSPFRERDDTRVDKASALIAEWLVEREGIALGPTDRDDIRVLAKSILDLTKDT